MPLIFDSHLDLGWNALTWKRDLTLPLVELNRREAGMVDELARGRATVSLPELRRARTFACLGTLMARVPYGEGGQVHGGSLDFPSHDGAYAFARGQLAYYRRLEARGEIALVRTAAELEANHRRWAEAAPPGDDLRPPPIGVVLAFEGCDAVVEPAQAEEWFAAGVRCAGLVHYGRSAYAAGTGEDGPVTPAGYELLAAFESLGVAVDLTHLCDQAFFQVLDRFGGPVFASHQNCRALVPGGRQFSDEQVRAVIGRGGVLGVAFDAWMLHPGWVRARTLEAMTPREGVSLEAAADHIDHICQLAGNTRHAALGSDLDGGFGTEQTPRDLNTVADLQRLDGILARRGYSEADIEAVFHRNWLEFFLENLPAG